MDKFKDTKNAGLVGILGNLFLSIIKATIGFVSHSQAMIADSFNSISDVFSSLMTFIGNRIASAPEDANHNFGHGKAEYIFSMFISLSMIVVSLKLLFDAFNSLINKNEFTFSWFLIVVSVVTIILKFFLFIYTKKLYLKHNNILLEASFKDHRNDCIVTTFTLISIFLGALNIFWFDGIVGIGISIWICFTGIRIFMESYNVLMDISIDDNTKDTILDLISLYKDIKNTGDIFSTPVGYKYLIIITIFVDGNMSTFDSHKLADDLERDILNINRVEKVIIHVNPI